MDIHIQSGEGDGLIFAFVQSQGERERQEDAFGHFETECFFIADGLGGLPYGGVASRMAVEQGLFAYRHYRKKHFYWRAKEHLVRQLFRSVSRIVFRATQEKYKGMATTFIASCFSSGWWWVGNVGDSRVYRLRDGKLLQITKDHQNDSGAITRFLGSEKFVAPDLFGGELQINDVFLLTTDGLTKGLSDSEIKRFLKSVGDSEDSVASAAQKMVKSALGKDDSDNVTVCIIKKLA